MLKTRLEREVFIALAYKVNNYVRLGAVAEQLGKHVRCMLKYSKKSKSLDNVQSTAALDLLPYSCILDHNAAIRGIPGSTRSSVAAVDQKSAAIGASLAADGAERVAVLHVVENDFLGELPGTPGTGAAVFATLCARVVAALEKEREE